MGVAVCHFPDLFETYAVVLNTDCILIELEPLLQRFRQGTPSSFTKDGLLRVDPHSRHVVVFLTSVFSDTERTCDHTTYLAV